MSKEYRVWVQDNSDENEATLVMDVNSAKEAAKEFVEVNHGDLGYPTEIVVCVMDDNGVVTRWTVTAEETTIFHVDQNKS